MCHHVCLLNIFQIIEFYVYECLPAFLFVHHFFFGVCIDGSQKRASNFLKLELQMFVSYHVGAGN